MLPIRTVLHPTDFSAYSDYSFRFACSLARDYGARVVILHVLNPPFVVGGEGVLLSEPVIDKDQLRSRLHQLQAGDPKVQVEHRLVEGDAANEILRVARETNCDLIVMGTHGRTGLGRLLMGSVAEQVMRKSTCPVLTVKAPHIQTASPEVSGKETARAETETTK